MGIGKEKDVKAKEKDRNRRLKPEIYNILKGCGTEPPFSGKYVYNKKAGVYICAGCGNKLFSSDAKFDSGTGWPSFWKPMQKTSVKKRLDFKLVVPRKEIVCGRCGGHLGHVFNDGPKPTGKRHCINSLALEFKKK